MIKNKKQTLDQESDSAFFLKIVVYVLLASFWLKFQVPLDLFVLALNGVPVGLFIGLILTRHDKFQIDRKIEYVVLVVMTIISYFLPAGIVL